MNAAPTIADLRASGAWDGDVALLSVGFSPPRDFLDSARVTCREVAHVDTDRLVAALPHQGKAPPFELRDPPGKTRHETQDEEADDDHDCQGPDADHDEQRDQTGDADERCRHEVTE